MPKPWRTFYWSTRRRNPEKGAVLLETVIVLPIMIFLILGALQLMLMQHGRIMTEYAAYNAARAGIVHNGNWNVMRNAAMLASLPVYQRTDNLPNFFTAWAKVKAAAEITEAVDTGVATLERLAGDILGTEISGFGQDLSLIEIHLTNPGADDFESAAEFQAQQEALAMQLDPKGPLRYPEAGEEIDFDDLAMLQQDPDITRLGVEVRMLYPLRIPLLNKIIFELWLFQMLLNDQTLRSDLPDWVSWQAKSESGQELSDAVAEGSGGGPLSGFFTTSQWTKEIRTLRRVAKNYGLYLIPIRATYAMHMHSNAFEKNRREPVWFSLN
ncbi:MAG: hypothetical protein CMH60_03315 [Myxococcales bacterium]|nr:hypothetical protein [Myxococcales bacterium]